MDSVDKTINMDVENIIQWLNKGRYFPDKETQQEIKKLLAFWEICNKSPQSKVADIVLRLKEAMGLSAKSERGIVALGKRIWMEIAN